MIRCYIAVSGVGDLVKTYLIHHVIPSGSYILFSKLVRIIQSLPFLKLHFMYVCTRFSKLLHLFLIFLAKHKEIRVGSRLLDSSCMDLSTTCKPPILST